MSPIVDRRARDEAAMLLRGFISGRVTNYDFEDERPGTDDPAISAVWSTAWCIYSYVRKHRLTGPDALHPATRREALRWLLFLDSDLAYAWPPRAHPGFRHPGEAERIILPIFGRARRSRAFCAAGDYAAWPFATRAEEARAKRHPRRLGGRKKKEPA